MTAAPTPPVAARNGCRIAPATDGNSKQCHTRPK